MRKAVYRLITEDPVLPALGLPNGAVFASHGLDTPPMRPFVILRWGLGDVGVGRQNTHDLAVWVHDEGGSYLRIDKLLNQIGQILTSAQPRLDDDGWFTQASWLGSSEDLNDDGYGTITRNGRFRCVGEGG